jgi:probable HAF family extracellular repeat protein
MPDSSIENLRSALWAHMRTWAGVVLLTFVGLTAAIRLRPNLDVPPDVALQDAGIRYSVLDLGLIPQIGSDLVPGLDSHGDSVYWRQDPSQTFVPVLYNGRAVDVLALPQGFRNGFPSSVNDAHEAVGWSNSTLNPVDSLSITHATLFRRDRAVDLGTLGGLRSRAYAINNNGVVVGVSDVSDKRQMGFAYSNGKMTELQALGGWGTSFAFDVNDEGVVVGAAEVKTKHHPKGVFHAVLWESGVPVDLGALTREGSSRAYAINSRGDIIGSASSALTDGETVFLYRKGRMVDLHIVGRAFSINDAVQIAGSHTAVERSRSTGFLWEKGAARDLNCCLLQDKRYHIESAFRVNNKGQILCSGFLGDERHFLLLSPAGSF